MFSRKSINNFLFPYNGFGAARTSVDAVLAKLTFLIQTQSCSYKVDIRTKCEHYSCKVDVVFANGRCFHKVDVLCRTFCAKKEENW